MAENQLLKLRLSLRGRPIKTYLFSQDCVLVGRNPEADVFLDNPGISRDHFKIERTQGGFAVEDLNSANGVYLNDRLVRREQLANEDVVRVGKFSLWVSLEEDRRGSEAARRISQAEFEGTTVLSTGELEEMMRVARKKEPVPPAPEAVMAAQPTLTRRRVVLFLAVYVAFLAGYAVGVSGILTAAQ